MPSPAHQSSSTPVDSTDDVSLTDTLVVLWRYRFVVLGLPLILAAVVWLVAYQITPRFEAVSAVEVNAGGRPVNAQAIESFRTRISSLLLAERVIAANPIEVGGRKLTAEELSSQITAQGVRNSALIRIRATSTEPATAARMANLIAEAAVSEAQEAQAKAAAAPPDARLESARRALEQFYERTPKTYWEQTRPADRPRQLSRTDMEHDVLMAAYRTALAEYVEGRSVAAVGPSLVLADRAATPIAPASPKPARWAAVTFALALGGSILLVLVVDAVRDRLRELR